LIMLLSSHYSPPVIIPFPQTVLLHIDGILLQ
jgi:hypothetical protein